jgi:hypothetical protein
MFLLRPSSPRALWADLRLFWTNRPRHQWLAAFLALLIPAAIVTVFYFDAKTNILPDETISYIHSWPAARSDAEIKAKQKADAALLEARRRERQRQFQELDRALNRMGI